MLTALAHDLRTPLTRLMLRLELSTDDKLRADGVRDLAKMQTLISRTLDFIRSADFGKHESNHDGNNDAATKRADVSTALTSVIAALPHEDAARIEVHGEVGAVCVVNMSAWSLERVLSNLIENALKYSPSDSAVVVSMSDDGVMARLSIRDHGAGVPEEALARLLEPFYRVDTARNMDEGGAGLGLSIVDNIVRAAKGEIDIRNHEEGGLVVTIDLPVAENQPDSSPIT
jgi:signal transduction histidine kinase